MFGIGARGWVWLLISGGGLALVPGACGQDEAVIPERFGRERYREVWSGPLFAEGAEIEEGEAPRVEVPPAWQLSGISKIGGEVAATLRRKEGGSTVRLRTGESAGGIKLIEVQEAAHAGEVRVRVEVGGRVMELGFEPEMPQEPVVQSPRREVKESRSAEGRREERPSQRSRLRIIVPEPS